MNNPYLIQRLDKPMSTENVWAFGGGKLNGGINSDAMKVIKQVFSFDYMGSAEFEWGAVPTALNALNNTGAIGFQIGGCPMPVYIICLPKDKEDVMTWVQNAALGIHGNLKERLKFQEALNKEKYADTLGWLKIENDRRCVSPFMFFIDKIMFDKSCDMLEVKNSTITA